MTPCYWPRCEWPGVAMLTDSGERGGTWPVCTFHALVYVKHMEQCDEEACEFSLQWDE